MQQICSITEIKLTKKQSLFVFEHPLKLRLRNRPTIYGAQFLLAASCHANLTADRRPNAQTEYVVYFANSFKA